MPLRVRFDERRIDRLLVDLLKQTEEEVDDDPLAQMDMQLMYYLKMSRAEIAALPLEEWAGVWCRLKRIREEEAQARPK